MDSNMGAFYFTPDSLQFRLYSTPEVLQLSVKEINRSQTFDPLSNPIIGGLHDPALGSTSHLDACGSCGQSERRCPGHFGHINLPVLLYKPVLLKQLLTLLRGTCMFCHKVKIQTHLVKAYQIVLSLLRNGQFVEAENMTNQFLYTKNSDTEELDLQMEQLAKSCPATNGGDSKLTQNLLRSMLDSIKHHMSRGTGTKCIHCQKVNRVLKFDKTTVIGVKGTAASKASDETKAREKASPHGEEQEMSLPEEEVEMDVDDGKMAAGEEVVGQANLGTQDVEDTKTVLASLGDVDSTVLDQDNEIESFTMAAFDKVVLSPYVARKHLRKVWAQESEFLKTIFPFLSQVTDIAVATDIFFLDVVPVVPTRFRPLTRHGDSQFEHHQTSRLADVINQKSFLVQILDDYSMLVAKSQSVHKGLESSEKEELQTAMINQTRRIYTSWARLQNNINCIFDHGLDSSGMKDPFGGVKQLLEKKQGLFRSNFMGKRVNFSARSIISPDPYIPTNQIGVPEVFASTLTYPQPVTPWNVHILRQLVINGPDKYPGAYSVINENGSILKLGKDQTQREAIANQLLVSETDVPNRKTVCRHLLNGDYVLMNRQPTLHRPSIQAHKARVLSGIRAFRLHYSNCKAYNADFDGDEMNLHFPQDELSRAEAATLACTDFQYLVPKDGTPLAGLIQDHVIAGVMLSIRGRFFNKDEYCSLLWGSMSDTNHKLKLLPPAILKPRALWSGKQVISTMILNVIPKDQAPFNLTGNAKIPEKSWRSAGMEIPTEEPEGWCSTQLGESTVVFRQGELLQGVLDKAHYGASAYGLVHSCYELYGGVIAGKLLTYLGRLFATFLQMVGFSLGVGDILVQQTGNRKRRKIIKKADRAGRQAMGNALSVSHDGEMDSPDMVAGYRHAHFGNDSLKMADIDMHVKKETDQIQDAITQSIMPGELEKDFPRNSLQLMVRSGAKGSPVNCMQISCLLGQIELEGRRPPLMMSGRALPCFPPYDSSLHAGGFVTGRFLTGIRPYEYFFHCMAGREGLIDTAVKTSRSGYLQRCLVKHLEGIMVNYDLTVRDADSSVIQFYYGEDGVDPMKSSFLKPEQFPFMADNLPALRTGTPNPWVAPSASKAVHKAWKRISKWDTQTNEERVQTARKQNDFLKFCQGQQPVDDDDDTPDDVTTLISEGPYQGRTALTRKLCRAWYEQDPSHRRKLPERKQCPDPVMTSHLPHSQPDVLSEKLKASITQYCQQHFSKGCVDKEAFVSVMNKKMIQALADPGEAVGVLCAQSVGEPSTQMTLNTFHFAGRGEMNVTLGIPRLKEILTGARLPKTPQCVVPIRDVPQAEQYAKHLKARLSMVTFNQVLESMKFNVVLVPRSGGNYKEFHVTLRCLPYSQYQDFCSMKFKDIANYVVTKFIPIVEAAVKKENRILQSTSLFASGNLKRTAYSRAANTEGEKEEEEGEKEEAANDLDSTFMKEQQRRLDTVEYEEEGEEEAEEVVSDDEGVHTGDDDKDDDDDDDLSAPDMSKEENEKLIAKAKSHSNVSAMTFDEKHKRSFTLTFKYSPEDLQFDLKLLFDTLVRSCVIQQVPGIRQAYVSKELEGDKTVWQLTTDGINLQRLFKYPYLLDLNRLYCNSIHHIWEVYGIEAANRAIIKEVQSVFGVYGIRVDFHHLSLLADYLTNQGSYGAFNRTFMNHAQTSSLQKITFETAMTFLLDTCINKHTDSLTSPSAQISIGKPVSVGTGSFHVLLK